MVDLEKIFGVKPEEAKQMSDVIEGNSLHRDLDKKSSVKQIAFFEVLESEKIQVKYGYHGNDYVWHVYPIKKPSLIAKTTAQKALEDPIHWKVPKGRLLYAVGSVIADTVPKDIIVDFYPPYVDRALGQDVAIQEVTIKAREFYGSFTFLPGTGKKIANQLIDVCKEFV